MSKLQNLTNLTPFIDYVPAELKENSTWIIEYYATDPFEQDPTKKLKRKRNRVRPMPNKTERRKYAKAIVASINEKLRKGWTPFLKEKNTKSFTKLFDAFDLFLKQTEQQIIKGSLREDTLRSYKSYINNLRGFIIETRNKDCFVTEFNENLCRDFLDMIFYERKNSARTHNNYLTFIGIFNRWLIKRRYVNIDFTNLISKIKETDKQRTIIPKIVREKIFNHLNSTNKNYETLCKMAFYCLIRRTEFTKLKVSDLHLRNGIINIRAEVSKNRKEQMVTIPIDIISVLVDHVKKADNSDFLFSANNFAPGKMQLDPKKISDYWTKIRKQLKFSKNYQWYSLKDTGITNYLQLGIPTIDVKNQARHHSIKQTEEYLPKNILKAIGNIQNAKLNF
ncbi:tyrosine-type recombinase/integrase [Tenacibaculum mesophilum]|uniref:tyrosine-type recombinase/integrase n=1 Tax=Tenacibaculum mesophilum TaxID=104268 RepID=UPI0024915080|nr:site-specific integrase [Tenacibaculum mesophilum]